MARFDFGGTLADFVVTSRRLGGLDTLALSSATLTFWSAQSGGTKYTDLVLNGSAVSSIAVASDGQVPKFQGPDGVTEMWVDGGSPRVRVVTLQGAPGPAGPTGPVSTVPGPTGATGPTGPQGIPGVNGVANDTATAGQISTPGTATDTALKAAYTQLTSIATTATASATLTANRHTPVNATSAALTMTLPSASAGALASVEKTDASANTVTITGTLRGVASSTIPLTSQYEARTFLSEGGGSWRPISDHRTAASLDASFVTSAAIKDFYISPAAGKDTNQGTTPARAFATLSAAKTAAGASPARFHLLDSITITTPDAYGNGFTLDQPGSVLLGRGQGVTQIKIATTVAYGVAAQAALCTIQGIQVATIAGGAVTYGVGVTTTNKTSGSCQSNTFRDVYVQVTAGSMVNGFGVGCDTTGGAIDIAETLFENCQARGTFTGVGFRIGNGTSANILNTTCRDCTALHAANGVYADHSNVIWSGNMGYNSTSDIHIESTCAGAYSFESLRSEGSSRLLTSPNLSNTVTLSMRDVHFSADQLNADGKWINYGMAGALRLANLKCATSAAVVPVVAFNTPGFLVVNASGVQSAAPAASAFSYVATKILVALNGYIQLSATGGDLPVAATGTAVQYPPATRVNAANPTGTVSTTLVMAGSAVPFTPAGTGKVKVTVTGTVASSVGPNNVSLAGRFGTGTAPANGAAVTGTGYSSSPTVRPPIASGGGITPFTLQDIVSGLTVGTAYWFDVAFSSSNATATANINNLVFILEEVS